MPENALDKAMSRLGEPDYTSLPSYSAPRYSVAKPQPTFQGQVPQDANLRAQTWSDKLRQARDQIGKIIAPFVGLDFNQMADDESKGILRQMLVFHGSPHTFDKFDMSKIGTGEGAQVYGHGLYFAENPKTATYYQKELTGGKTRLVKNSVGSGDDEVKRLARDVVAESGVGQYRSRGIANEIVDAYMLGDDFDAMRQFIRKSDWSPAEKDAYSRGMAFVETYRLERPKGGLYSAKIPDEHVAKMLDYDKPFGEQAPEVQKALSQIKLVDVGMEAEPVTEMPGLSWIKRQGGGRIATTGNVNPQTLADIPNVSFNNLHDSVQRAGKAADLSDLLNKNGVPGIKYLDAGSRSQGMTTYTAKWTPDGMQAEVFDRATGASHGTFPSFEEADKWIQDHAPKPTRNIVVFDPEILQDVKRQ